MPEIILIGPSGTGKSTQGKLLAERLGLQQVSLDTLRWQYYAEMGYDAELARTLRETQGFPALIKYWQQFDPHMVERALAEHHECVIDFGAGHSVYDDEAAFERVQTALAPYPHVFLLLPSADLEESSRLLAECQQSQAPVADRAIIGEIVRHHVMHPSNHRLAKLTFYTKGKTPEATCDEIMRTIGGRTV